MQKTQAQQEQIIALSKEATELVKAKFTHEELAYHCWSMFGVLSSYCLLDQAFSPSFDDGLNSQEQKFRETMLRLELELDIETKLAKILGES